MARLDAVMVQQGMVPSRQRAKTLIQNGQISVNGKVCTKPAFAVSETDRIAMEGSDIPFVGRGGLKLEHAVQQMQPSGGHGLSGHRSIYRRLYRLHAPARSCKGVRH
ncbi:MAG: S4 domain-containing protein [Ruminococcus callidus]